MSEVCTPPLILSGDDGDLVAFGDDHSLADIARWIMQNRADGETLRDILTMMLDGVWAETMQ